MHKIISTTTLISPVRSSFQWGLSARPSYVPKDPIIQTKCYIEQQKQAIELHCLDDHTLISFMDIDCTTLSRKDVITRIEQAQHFVDKCRNNFPSPGFRMECSLGLLGLRNQEIKRVFNSNRVIFRQEYCIVHVRGKLSDDVLDLLSTLSQPTDSLLTQGDPYPNVALVMSFTHPHLSYNVLLKSAASLRDQTLKLNPATGFEHASTLKIKSLLQQRVVSVKLTMPFTDFIKQILDLFKQTPETSSMPATHTFQSFLIQQLLTFTPILSVHSAAWDPFTAQDKQLDLNTFKSQYNAFVLQLFGNKKGVETYLIGDTEKNMRKAREVLTAQNQEFSQFKNAVRTFQDPGIAKVYQNRSLKFLPPFYRFLDYRKQRGPADPARLFKWDETGVRTLNACKFLIAQHRLLHVHVSKGKLYKEMSGESFQLNEVSFREFEVMVNIQTFLCCLSTDQHERFINDIISLIQKMGIHAQTLLSTLSRKFNFSPLSSAEIRELSVSTPSTQAIDTSALSYAALVDLLNQHIIAFAAHNKLNLLELKSNLYPCISKPTAIHRETRFKNKDCLEIEIPNNLKPLFQNNPEFTRFPINEGEHHTYAKLIYVIMPDGEIRLTEEALSQDTGRTSRLTHSQIAQMQPVYDAGELLLEQNHKSKKWAVIRINNSSGHYQPQPEDALEGVKLILSKALSNNRFFELSPTCSVINSLSATRLSKVDDTTQVIGEHV